jgi:hypothetical protein
MRDSIGRTANSPLGVFITRPRKLPAITLIPSLIIALNGTSFAAIMSKILIKQKNPE